MNKLNWLNGLYNTASGYITVALSFFIGFVKFSDIYPEIL